MKINDIEKLILNGESHTLELKKSTAQLRSACETACAFLNTDSGIVLLGVTDNHRIIGQEVSDKTKREIGNELAKISPVSNVEVAYINIPSTDKFVIVFQVTADSTQRPYLYDGRAFMRIQSDTLPMPREHLNHLTIDNSNTNHYWENQTQDKMALLENDEILATIREGVLNNRIPESYSTQDPIIALKRLGLIIDNKITNAAIVLFAQNPELIFPQCVLRLARFRGINKDEFIDNKQVSGNIFKLLKEAMAFASTHLPIASTFHSNSIKRIDKPLFPILALREAIANALCHRLCIA